MKKFLENTKKEFFLLCLPFIPYAVLGVLFILIPFARHSGWFWLSWHVFLFMVFGGILAYVKSHFTFHNKYVENITDILLTIVTWAGVFLVLLKSLIIIPFLLLFQLFPYTQPIVHFMIWVLARTMTFLFGIHVEVEGERPQGMFLIAPNHASSLDYFLIVDILGPSMYKVVAGTNLLKFPIFNFFLKLKCIFVDRRNEASKRQSAEESRVCIKQAVPLVIFFEGGRKRRSEEGVIRAKHKIEKGIFVLSKRSNVPILPLAIIGAGDFKPPVKGEPLAKKWWLFQWWNSPTQIKAVFLPLVHPLDKSVDEITDEVCSAIEGTIRTKQQKTVSS